MSEYQGVIDLSQFTDGRLRQFNRVLTEKAGDPLVPARLVQQFSLRTGMNLTVTIGHAKGSENGKGKRKKKSRTARELASAPRVESILQIEGIDAEHYKAPPLLEQCTSVDPHPIMKLEYPGCPPACRLIDLFCPIGFGQ